MYRNPKIPSLLRRVGVSVSLGLIIAAMGASLEMVISGHSFSWEEALDDVFIGIFAALVVFAYEQRRYRATLEKVQVIAAMNHHVRNALQAISYAPYTEQATQIKLVEESVSRIEWALREILPGAFEAHEGFRGGSPEKYPTPRLQEKPRKSSVG